MRWKSYPVVMFGLVLATVAATAVERVSAGGAQWPNVALDEPQWPNLRLDDIEAPRVNKHPSFVDPQEVEDRIMGRKPRAAAKPSAASKPGPQPAREPAANGLDANASAGAARWPTLRPEKQVSPFAFEVGGRYWYSSGRMSFGFANGSPFFGNPTSTLDWHGLSAHSGEVFARIDHIPSGVFVKGLVGLGSVAHGHIDDMDFLVTQFKFSDTTSDVHNGNLSYAMLDVGWAYTPTPGVRLGFFVGYHYWHEKVTAYGIVCNMPSVIGCPAAGAVIEGPNVAVGSFEPTIHAARIGVESRIAVDEHWSFSGEIAGVPYAALNNKDSHLLRQSMDDLGPAPNVITNSSYAFGVEAELFVNYALTSNIEMGAGVRYWGVMANRGGVQFGPDFVVSDSLNKFDQQRYGVLLHVKGKF
jgi:outer membrane protease